MQTERRLPVSVPLPKNKSLITLKENLNKAKPQSEKNRKYSHRKPSRCHTWLNKFVYRVLDRPSSSFWWLSRVEEGENILERRHAKNQQSERRSRCNLDLISKWLKSLRRFEYDRSLYRSLTIWTLVKLCNFVYIITPCCNGSSWVIALL